MNNTFLFENIKKYFRKENLIVLILVGILMFVIVIPVNEGRDVDEENIQQPIQEREESDSSYIAEMEQKLEEILSSVADVGEVKVMITLKSSEEKVIEMERYISTSSTVEEDAQGTKRTIENNEKNPKVVYYTDGAVSDPYVIRVNSPRIEGVLVVAQGAGRGTIDRTMSGIVQALFGIEAHRVRVVKMENKED